MLEKGNVKFRDSRVVACWLALLLSPLMARAQEYYMPKGSWMVNYRFMFMDMVGNRSGSSSVSTAEVLEDFRVSPLKMTMDMNMVNLMHGVTDNLAVMVMVPHIEKSMDHVTRTGAKFTTKSEGVGDVSLMARLTRHKGTNWVYFYGGVRLPTGSIDESGPTPAGPNSPFPYPMQIGTGTTDLLPGIEYDSELPRWRLGVKLRGEFSSGENDHHYRVGNRYHLLIWNKWPVRRGVDFLFSLDGHQWRDYTGADPRLDPAVVPTAVTSMRGGERLDATAGVNIYRKVWDLRFEAGAPVYQSLHGPQLETDLVTMLRFRYYWD